MASWAHGARRDPAGARRSGLLVGGGARLRDRPDPGLLGHPVLSLRLPHREPGPPRVRSLRIDPGRLSPPGPGRPAALGDAGFRPRGGDPGRLCGDESDPLRLLRHRLGPPPDLVPDRLLPGAGSALLLRGSRHRRAAVGAGPAGAARLVARLRGQPHRLRAGVCRRRRRPAAAGRGRGHRGGRPPRAGGGSHLRGDACRAIPGGGRWVGHAGGGRRRVGGRRVGSPRSAPLSVQGSQRRAALPGCRGGRHHLGVLGPARPRGQRGDPLRARPLFRLGRRPAAAGRGHLRR